MDGDQKFWISLVFIIVMGIVSIACVIGGSIVTTRTKMVVNGYEQVSIEGVSGSVWQKADCGDGQ